MGTPSNESVKAAMKALVVEGRRPSVRAVLARLGEGSVASVHAAIREIRAASGASRSKAETGGKDQKPRPQMAILKDNLNRLIVENDKLSRENERLRFNRIDTTVKHALAQRLISELNHAIGVTNVTAIDLKLKANGIENELSIKLDKFRTAKNELSKALEERDLANRHADEVATDMAYRLEVTGRPSKAQD
jgi:hypothetical protein